MNSPEKKLSLALSRAEKLDDAESVDKLQFLVFQAGKGFYGLNIIETHEILKPVPVTRLPNVEEEILGVINLRGNIIPVIDVKRKFLGKHADLSGSSRIVVSAYKGKFMGLLVDRIVEVARIANEDIEGNEVKGMSKQFVKGVGRSESRLFLILNLSVLIGSQTEES